MFINRIVGSGVLKNQRKSMNIGITLQKSTSGVLRPRTASLDLIFSKKMYKEENYLHMLENFFWPYIQNKRLASKIMFQQDGAAAHFSLIVRNWLNDRLPGRWIGRRGPIEWAARSPDLTPLDFFLWGYIKQKVYTNKHIDLDRLRESIKNVIKSISLKWS